MSSLLRRSHRAALVLGFAFLSLSADRAIAGKDHCRILELGGAAGGASADKVELQVTDYNGNILDRSCKITVQSNQCAADLAKQLVAEWGNGAVGGSQTGCGINQALTTTCGKNPLAPDLNIFCKHRFRAGKLKPGVTLPPGVCPTTAQLKKLPKIEVCCYEENADVNPLDPTTCRGAKLGKTFTNPKRIEISVFDRIDRPNQTGDGLFFEPKYDAPDNSLKVPVLQSSRQVALDPIGIQQKPAPASSSCRSDVAKAAAGLDETVTTELTKCRLAQIKDGLGGICPGAQEVEAIAQAMVDVEEAAASCEGDEVATQGPQVSPILYGLTPALCDPILGMPLGTCSAGLVGNLCESDRDCDTAAGTSDGRCGSWDDGADCISVLQESTAQALVDAVFGSLAGPLPVSVYECLETLAKNVVQLVDVNDSELVSCQAKADRGKAALPPDTPFCKDADLKGLRAAAETKLLDGLTDRCTDADVLQLDTCGNGIGGTTTVAQLQACILDAAGIATEALSTISFPESNTVCGNDKMELGEQCDVTDDSACQGLCQGDCTCPPPVCGNNVTEAVEQCDGTSDLYCPGLCLPSCMCPVPVCGNNITEGSVEQCDGTSDAACPGLCLIDCTCQPNVCGNNDVELGEQCDGTDDESCPGLCAANCTCPAGCPVGSDLIFLPGTGTGGTSATSLDIGWTGSAHGQDLAEGVSLSGLSTCPVSTQPCGICTIDGIDPSGPATMLRCSNDPAASCTTMFAADPACGAAICVPYLGPPHPMMAPGAPTCSLRYVPSDVSGYTDWNGSSGVLNLPTHSIVHLGASLLEPCPLCTGDPVPLDGATGGVCNGGSRSGLSCDAQGFDATFAPEADSDALSLDCPPHLASNISGSGLSLDLALTTGLTSLVFNTPCDGAFAGFNCACAVCTGDTSVACRDDSECVGIGTCSTNGSGPQRLPNGCSDLICTDVGGSGQCQAGLPGIDDLQYCDGQLRANGEPLLECTSNTDCTIYDPECDAGDCGECTIVKQRSCFLDPIQAVGIAHSSSPVVVATGCLAPTANPAINVSRGLPGPVRVVVEGDLTWRY